MLFLNERPDYISSYENVYGNAGMITLDHGRPPAPAYEYGDTHIDHGEHK